MEKRRQNIIIWIIAWASLLLLVLYSPIGSPDLYNKDVKYSNTRGGNNINFTYNIKKTAILKTTAIKDESFKINIANNSTENKKKPSYRVTNSERTSNGYAFPMINNNLQDAQNKNGIRSSGNNFTEAFSDLGTESNTQSTFQSKRLISISTDLSTLVDNNITRQGGETIDPLGTTDPGGDPFGPPIPVPDGWGFLLVLAGIYTIAKKYFFK